MSPSVRILHATKTKVVTRTTPVLDSYSSYDERQSFFRRRKRENERRRRRRRAEASSSSSSSSFVVPDDVANEDDEDADELTKTKTTRLYCLLTACLAERCRKEYHQNANKRAVFEHTVDFGLSRSEIRIDETRVEISKRQQSVDDEGTKTRRDDSFKPRGRVRNRAGRFDGVYCRSDERRCGRQQGFGKIGAVSDILEHHRQSVRAVSFG